MILIWNTTLVLAIASIATLLVLIVRRKISARRKELAQKRRTILNDLLLISLNSPVDLTKDVAKQITLSDHALLIDIALDYVRSMQGEESEKIATLVYNWIGKTALAELLQKSRRGSKIGILTLLSHLEDQSSFDLLLRYGVHGEPYVQLAALQSLAKRSDHRQIGSVLKLIKRIDETNSIYLADVLSQLDVSAVPHLIQQLGDELNKSVSVAIIVALGNIGDKSATLPLINLAHAHNSATRNAIAETLGEIGDALAAPALVELAMDENEVVRRSAIDALGNLNEPSVLPTLYNALSDPVWWVRYTAARALVRYGDGGIALLRLTSGQNGLAAKNASQVLKEYRLARL